MLSDSDWDMLARYVAGEISATERPEIERWVGGDPARERAVEELRSIWETRSRHVDVNAAWLRFKARTTTHFTFARTTRPARMSVWLKAAVIAAVLAGGALVARALLFDRPEASQLAMREAAVTERGEIRTVRLDDGTNVTLGVASRLLVAADFGEKQRVVQLEGEGFFDVAHDAQRPFVVRTATATAQALGTEFGVTAREGSVTRVVVSGGQVLVKPTAADAHSEAVVNAGELAQVTSTRDAVDVERTDPARLLAWREGRLVFQNQQLSEVVDQLEYWYNVEFIVTDSALARRRMSGSFVRPTLEQVMQSITLTVNATYRTDGRRVILASNK